MNIVLIIVPGLICLIALSLVAARRKAAKFNAVIQELAGRLNMRLSREADFPEHEDLRKFYLFKGTRSSHRVQNLMERSGNEITVRFFEYSYSYSSGFGNGRARNHTRAVVAIHNPTVNLPVFEMYPETLLNRACDKLTPDPQDILFEHHPKFSRMFMFETEEGTAVHRLFSDQAIQQFEECKGQSLAASGEWILFYRKLKPRTVEQMEAFIRSSTKIYETMRGSDDHAIRVTRF
jgi:hypothetical protein